MKTKYEIDGLVFALIHFLGNCSNNELPADVFEELTTMLLREGLNEKPKEPVGGAFEYIEKCKIWDILGVPGHEFTKLYDRIEATYTHPFEKTLLHLFVELALDEEKKQSSIKNHYKIINGLYQS